MSSPVILSRRSAAKNLKLRRLRSFAVYAAQDDEGVDTLSGGGGASDSW